MADVDGASAAARPIDDARFERLVAVEPPLPAAFVAALVAALAAQKRLWRLLPVLFAHARQANVQLRGSDAMSDALRKALLADKSVALGDSKWRVDKVSLVQYCNRVGS